ncbi:MAG TPA: 7-cyano-7-deazaguanine synthase, partial [Planctomycetota bacterium]|nr:7-cyano-7-deazaguanine synthase [Planctomycetota bacterium]
LALTFDYGQRAAGREAAAAQRLAARFGVAWRGIDLPWLAQASAAAGSALVARGRPLPAGTRERPGDQQSAAAVWVPARNAVFVAIAAALAEAGDATVVLAGFNREEALTFADNSAGFVAAATAFLGFGTRIGVRVESPTLAWDKRGIVAAAREHGLRPADFWSCYEGDADPCGRCESCLRSLRAWDGQTATAGRKRHGG